MDKFGFLNTVYALCDGDLLKMDSILQLPNSDVFLKLYHDVEMARFQKDYREVMKKENK